MIQLKSFAYAILVLALFWSGALSCAGEGGGLTFAITPAGPTPVIRGNTLQFATDPGGLAVTWSVEGGADNGSIDGSGLFTAPDILPPNTLVEVTAQMGGQEATAMVDLQAADILVFGPTRQLNDTPIIQPSLLVETLAPSGNRLGVREGSLQVDAGWSEQVNPTPSPTPNVGMFHTQSIDFGPFSPPMDISVDPNGVEILAALFTDQNQNPGILFFDFESEPLDIFFRGSTDGGQSFNAPVQVSTTDEAAFLASAHVDGLNNYHIAFSQIFQPTAATPTPLPEVYYRRSSDQGQTWTDPIVVDPFMEVVGIQAQVLANISTSEDGQRVGICYLDAIAFPLGGNINVALSTDGGESFGTIVKAENGSEGKGTCNIAFGPLGEIYVVFHTIEGAMDDEAVVFFVRSLDDGQIFSLPNQLSSDNFKASANVFMSTDTWGRIDVAWTAVPNMGTQPSNLFHTRSVDGGVTFSEPNLLAGGDPDHFIFIQGLVHDEGGRLHIQYILGEGDFNDPNETYDIFYVMAE